MRVVSIGGRRLKPAGESPLRGSSPPRRVSLHDLKVYPTGRHAALPAGQRVPDDDLEDVLAGQEVGADQKAPGGEQASQLSLPPGVESLRRALVNQLPVAEQTGLRGEARSARRPVEPRIVDEIAIVER